MPFIDLQNVTKLYPLDMTATARSMRDVILGRSFAGSMPSTKRALNDICIHIDAGERIGIIGPNGAGKSTLLHLIAGVTEPTSGHIQIDGHVTSILTLGIGLREEMTGRENIYLDGEIQGRSRKDIEAVIDQIIEFAELDEFIDRPVRTYSTGMKSRLAFAMISHLDPEILLIDEALSVGDAKFSAKATRRIREICARGKIVVIVSHGMGAIREICNRCIWLENGQVVMDGPPNIVTEAYVDVVRKADEAKLLEKFRSQLASESLVAGYSITMLETAAESQSAACAVLPAEQAQVIRCSGTYAKVAPSIAVRLRIDRLDGLLLVNESAPLAEVMISPADFGSFSFELVLPPALAHGIYRVEVGLVDGEKLLARRATIMELTCNDPPTGGRPALYYPYSISASSR